jgi:HEAT repeat protein
MPRKTTKKKTETRYTSTPTNTKAADAKTIAAKQVEVKSPAVAQANVEAPVKSSVESPMKPIAESKPSPAAAALIAALRQTDADVARDAATSLASLGESAAVLPLIQVLENTDNYYHSVVRAAAAAGLGKLGDSRAIDSLLITIQDSLAEPSAEAIRSLGAIGDPRAISALIDVVRNPTGFYLPIARRAAVLALSRFGADPRVAAELLSVSNNSSEDAVIRQTATDAVRSSAKK